MEDSANGDFGHVSARSISWLHNRGTSVNPKISLTDLRSQDAGRGVGIVSSSKPTGEFWLMLVQLPSTISRKEKSSSPSNSRTYLAWRHPGSRSCYRKNLKTLMNGYPWFFIVLIYEYGQGEQSAWRLYLDILPARFDTLAFWTPQQLEELQGSAVVKKIGTEEADETFKTRLLPIVAVHPDILGVYATAFRGPDAESVLLKLAHSMATLIMAYGFDLEAERPDTDSEDKDS